MTCEVNQDQISNVGHSRSKSATLDDRDQYGQSGEATVRYLQILASHVAASLGNEAQAPD